MIILLVLGEKKLNVYSMETFLKFLQQKLVIIFQKITVLSTSDKFNIFGLLENIGRITKTKYLGI